MSPIAPSNRLLASLSSSDRQVFDPCLQGVQLEAGTVLSKPNVPASHAYFLESGIAASALDADSGRNIEVGLTGNEGFIGLPIILDAEQCSRMTIMLVGGRALRIEAQALRYVSEAIPTIRSKLLNFVHTFIIQTSSTVTAHATLSTEQKLARWLLMAQDRLGDDLEITHDFLAMVLGVRRPGVTVAIHVLEGEHALAARRKQLKILDRDKLKMLAGPSYGVAEAEYDRVFGHRHRPVPPDLSQNPTQVIVAE